jgi:uncharacterized membrane protein YhaH (DUF805 family)
MDWYLDVLKNRYAKFDGRARRKEYWMFALFNFLIAVALSIVDGILHLKVGMYGMGVLGTLYALALLIPNIAISIRRLHDTDRSGWWLLILLVPIIGAIVLLVFMVLAGTAGENRYGPDPKAASA